MSKGHSTGTTDTKTGNDKQPPIGRQILGDKPA